jgi:hypothetical protein
MATPPPTRITRSERLRVRTSSGSATQ